ncbi:MAG: NUDIX hydrolase [Pseudomonadota bacterium]
MLTRSSFGGGLKRAASGRSSADAFSKTLADLGQTDATSTASSVTHYSAVLIKAEGEGPFLLQERPKTDDVEYAGRFSLFGGRHQGSESPEGTAVREVVEETGMKLDADRLALLGQIDSFNENGAPTIGSIFLAEGIAFSEVENLDIQDGRGVLLKRNDAARQWSRLTPIALFAIAMFDELDRMRHAKRVSSSENSFAAHSRPSFFQNRR